MATYPPEAWTRLGALLRARRVVLDPSYRHRKAFCESTGADYRVVFDIEQAKRTNFTPETLIRLEMAYGLQAGAIVDALNGGELRAAGTPPTRPPVMDVQTSQGVVMIRVSPDAPMEELEELRQWGELMARYLEERRRRGDA